MRNLSMITTLAAGILMAVSAGAQTTQSTEKSDSHSKLREEITKVRDACKSDMDKYCKGISQGDGRIASCLHSREDQLSPNCSKAWTDANAKVTEKLNQAELSFRRDCGTDVQKFCSSVPSGQGRLASCLGEHEQSLSNSCRSFQAKVRQKLNRAFG